MSRIDPYKSESTDTIRFDTEVYFTHNDSMAL